MPLFIPVPEIGNKFSNLIDKYPVSPYLGSRESFVRWVHFIHNKVNASLGKEEISFLKSIDLYKSHYKDKPFILSETLNMRKHYLHAVLTFSCIFLIYKLAKDS
jgi:hypothetical protein